MMRGLTAVFFVLMLGLTLAPRTSQFLSADWDAYVMSDTLGSARHPVQNLTFAAVPTSTPPERTEFIVRFSAGEPELVAATPGCFQDGDDIRCDIATGGVRRQHLISITVRSVGDEQLSPELLAISH